MKTALFTSALVMASALALAPMAQAKTLKPGNYNFAGLQQICLVSGGTWYGETYPSWSGTWGAGPTKEDATIMHGNYNSGAGNDSMVVTGGSVDWTEWSDDESFQNFIDSTVSRIPGKCTAPDARATTKKNPMD
jgi:hypothetical protein